ncbi:MAG: phage major capsid protein [Sideroxydans sp.]|nr:phage major capsid protein [Sideroxydans sp.]
MTLKELQGKKDGLLKQLGDLVTVLETENRELTAEEKETVDRIKTELQSVKEQIDASKQKADDNAALIRELRELTAGVRLPDPGNGGSAAGIAPPERGKTIGQQFLEAKAFRDWLQFVAPDGHVPEGGQLPASARISFNGLMAHAGFGAKTLVTGDADTSGGAFIQTDYTGIYEPLGRYALTVRDLVTVRQTQSDTVSFVRQTAQVTEAAPTAEANVTEYSGATGEVEGAKPEGAVAFEVVESTVKTIPVWIPVTKQALSDASQIRGIIDQELRADVQEELEDQILNGSGAGANFTGLTNTANVLIQAWDTDLLTTARKAKTALRTTGKSVPTAWLMNPEDFETLDLLTDEDGQFYYGGPQREGMRMLWGVPVVESDFVDQGTALLGDWRKAVIWDRQQATIAVSEHHSDFFTRNMVAIRCELRAAFGVIRPTAFIEVAMESGS